jgi:hypothetical protein
MVRVTFRSQSGELGEVTGEADSYEDASSVALSRLPEGAQRLAIYVDSPAA